MKKVLLALIILIPSTGLILLPAEVILHFNASGMADRTISRTASILLYTVFSIFLTFVPSLIARGFGSFFNARIPYVLRVFSICLGIWTFLFWILIIVANTIGHGHLSATGTWLVSIVLLIPVVLFLELNNPTA
jgi:uncharacterized membrane protein YtjA (UPF0391 family)